VENLLVGRTRYEEGRTRNDQLRQAKKKATEE